MAQSMVSFRMDAALKKAMEETCRKMGLSMSAAFTIFATKVTREQRIPFEVNTDPFYSEENMKRLQEAIADVEAGRNTLKSHDLIEA